MKKFKRIYIEVTNICNLNCEFCPQMIRKPEMMSLTAFEQVLEQIKGLTNYIYLHVMGEPLLHPRIKQFLELANNHNLKVNLTTNGVLLEEAQQVLLNSPALRQINISLHSLAVHTDRVRVEEYLSRVSRFIIAAQKQGRLYIALRLWNLDAEVGSASRTENELIFQHLSAALGITKALPEGITAGNGIELLPRLFLSQSEEFVWPSPENSWAGDKGFCHGLRDQVAILVDGTVVPCCLDSNGIVALGNVHQNTLEEILKTPRAKAISEGFSERKVVEELCQKCSFRKRFAK